MSGYPCCKHCDHDPGYEHESPCLVCGRAEPAVIFIGDIEYELS